jgi:hypothetical protein
MLKTENSIIFTCFEEKSYFSCFILRNNIKILFSASAKGCVNASTSIIFRYFLLLCVWIFLLPMNGVNMKYWFRDFQKKKFIDFMDELGLFIEEKPVFTKKKFPSLCRLPWFHCSPNEKFCPPDFWKMLSS